MVDGSYVLINQDYADICSTCDLFKKLFNNSHLSF